MHFSFQRRCFTFFLMITLCFSGCISRDAKLPRRDFQVYTREVFRDMVSSDTLTLHYTLAKPEAYQLSTKHISLGDFSPSSFSQERRKLTLYLDTLKTYHYDRLSASNQETYDTLKDYLETRLALCSTPYLASILSPTLGVTSQLPVSLSEYSFRKTRDIVTYISLLSKIPSYFDSIIMYEKEQLKRGYFMSDETLSQVISQIRGFAKSGTSGLLVSSFSSRIKELTWLSKKKKHVFLQKNRQMIQRTVLPAYRHLADTLERYKGLGKQSLGLSHYKYGRRYYSALVHSLTGSRRSMNTLIGWTDRDLKTLSNRLGAIAKKDIKGFYRYLNLSKRFLNTKNPKGILDDLKDAMKHDFPASVESRITVKKVAPSMQETSSPAFYMVPPIDSYQENVIYINPLYTKEPVTVYQTLAHEGYPGHLYQTTYSYHKKKDLIRYVLNFPGYCEGWATYAEDYSFSYLSFSANSSTIQTLLSYDDRFRLALSSRIDFGVNYEGWNLKQVNDLLATYHIRDQKIGTQIYQEVIMNPGNYLSYYIGFLEFKHLKANYKKTKGKDYSEKSFHTFVLNLGPTSFSTLEKHMSKSNH